MRTCLALFLLLALAGASRAYALDLGPVHIRGTDVKVGGEVKYNVVIDKITREEAKTGEEKNAKIRTIYGHRKDGDDKFEITVPYDDLDDDSKDMLKKVEEGKTFNMKVKRMDDNWKLIKLREKD